MGSTMEQNRYLWHSDRSQAVWDGCPVRGRLNNSSFMNDGLSANNTIIESRVRGPVLKASDTIRHAAEVLAGYGPNYWTYFFWANGVPADDPFK